MKKGSVELGADDEEGESESKVINQIFGRLQHPKNEVRYLEDIFSESENIFSPFGGVCYKSYKRKYHSICKNENFVSNKYPIQYFFVFQFLGSKENIFQKSCIR